MTKAWVSMAPASMALNLGSLMPELLEVARETLAARSSASPGRVKARNREIGRADPATPAIAGSERPYGGHRRARLDVHDRWQAVAGPRLLMIISLITTNRRARTTMGSALERHAAGRDLPAVREKARELAAASVSANTRRAYASMCVL